LFATKELDGLTGQTWFGYGSGNGKVLPTIKATLSATIEGIQYSLTVTANACKSDEIECTTKTTQSSTWNGHTAQVTLYTTYEGDWSVNQCQVTNSCRADVLWDWSIN